ncbi:hypothetical protein SAMN04515624_1407 [Eubacterium maltosivorans]|uniref:oligosaccharide repeat unit polymerase n=1 Tax=Eubacterium maltosivorans TaxID=2041044 RepID=UPI00087F0A77|nr:oligosaccharide repeat unit polymerase [Eubacterium maltosivorans]WPK80834.1 hypothetical protein EUMA32_22460 [Eubacterium maltosivorans]SDP84667.1 hypothetical protein SAMN04515624_1407 [Eubacterium maltosivorans]
MAERIVITIYCLCHGILAVFMIQSREYVGEAKSMAILKVSNIVIILNLIIIVVGYILLYCYYLKTKDKKTKFKVIVEKKKFHIFFLVLLCFSFLFFLLTDVGKAGTNNRSTFSFLFSMFSIKALFPFYYFLGREKKIIYVFNIVIFVLYRLLQGWSGFLFDIFIYELFLYCSKHKDKIKFKNIKIFFYSFLALLFSGVIYQYIYGLKNYIRYEVSKINFLTFRQGLIEITNRLSFFPQATAALQNQEIIKSIYINYSPMPLKEIIAFFRPIMPSFIMTNKIFLSINAIAKQSMVMYPIENTSLNIGIISYAISLFNADLMAGIIWIILLFVSIKAIRIIIKSLEEYQGQLDILYFILLINVYNIGSLETVIASNYIPLLFMFPVLWFLKIFKIYRVKINNREGVIQ